MSHYEERLQRDLDHIRNSLAVVSSDVENALKNAVHALLTGKTKLAYATVLGDLPINRKVREIDRLCHAFIAVHLPSGAPLRLISSIIRANIALERIGDYAVTVCREAVQLSKTPMDTVAREVELMADEAGHMLHQAIEAFNDGNAEAAKATMGLAEQVERTFDNVFAELTSGGNDWATKDLFGLFVVFNMLERVSDQAKNMCEETVFATLGQAKAPKRYVILFVDEDNSCQSQMAEAIARKSFPESGSYSSAGRSPAAVLNPDMVKFMEARGFDLKTSKPRELDLTPQETPHIHIVVSLQGAVKTYFQTLPFHTTALEWDVSEPPAGLDEAETTQHYEHLYRDLASNIRSLMEILHGEGAR